MLEVSEAAPEGSRAKASSPALAAVVQLAVGVMPGSVVPGMRDPPKQRLAVVAMLVNTVEVHALTTPDVVANGTPHRMIDPGLDVEKELEASVLIDPVVLVATMVSTVVEQPDSSQ
jgi:hypothetical protein